MIQLYLNFKLHIFFNDKLLDKQTVNTSLYIYLKLVAITLLVTQLEKRDMLLKIKKNPQNCIFTHKCMIYCLIYEYNQYNLPSGSIHDREKLFCTDHLNLYLFLDTFVEISTFWCFSCYSTIFSFDNTFCIGL